MKMKIIVGITGASGSIYAQRLVDKLANHPKQAMEVALIASKCGVQVWAHELGVPLPVGTNIEPFDNESFFSAPASGSAGYDAMVIIPCTMGTLGRISQGSSTDLISRSADVMLKERKKLVLVVRETPYSLVHIENMRMVTLAGGVILPASPSFYSHPRNTIELIDTVVDRAIGMLGIPVEGYQWKGGK